MNRLRPVGGVQVGPAGTVDAVADAGAEQERGDGEEGEEDENEVKHGVPDFPPRLGSLLRLRGQGVRVRVSDPQQVLQLLLSHESWAVYADPTPVRHVEGLPDDHARCGGSFVGVTFR